MSIFAEYHLVRRLNETWEPFLGLAMECDEDEGIMAASDNLANLLPLDRDDVLEYILSGFIRHSINEEEVKSEWPLTIADAGGEVGKCKVSEICPELVEWIYDGMNPQIDWVSVESVLDYDWSAYSEASPEGDMTRFLSQLRSLRPAGDFRLVINFE